MYFVYNFFHCYYIIDFSRGGTKKFGDACDSHWECGFPNSKCDQNIKQCHCDERFPATNHIDKCGKCK